MSQATARKRVLIVHMSLYNGGAERSLINFLSTLPDDAYDIDLLLFRTEGIFLNELPGHVHLLETPEPLRTLYYNPNSRLPRAGGVRGLCIRAARAFGSALAAALSHGSDNLRRQKRWRLVFRHIIPRLPGHYDVALAYFHGEISYYVMDKVSAARKVAFVHNDYTRIGQSPAIDMLYYTRFAQVASISDLCVSALQTAFPAIRDRFVVVPNLTSAHVVRALSQAYEPQEYEPGVPRLLSVGRLNAQKAYDLAIEAARILRDQGVAFVWYIIGDGGLRGSLEDMIRVHGLQSRVRLLGVRANPYPYMRGCDVFVQSSRYEGKSMVLDEAKILHRPIVSTAYPTVADQIEKDVEGLIVPMTPAGLADGISRMLADSALRGRFSATLAAREYDNTAGIALYHRLLTGEPSDRTREA